MYWWVRLIVFKCQTSAQVSPLSFRPLLDSKGTSNSKDSKLGPIPAQPNSVDASLPIQFCSPETWSHLWPFSIFYWIQPTILLVLPPKSHSKVGIFFHDHYRELLLSKIRLFHIHYSVRFLISLQPSILFPIKSILLKTQVQFYSCNWHPLNQPAGFTVLSIYSVKYIIHAHGILIAHYW